MRLTNTTKVVSWLDFTASVTLISSNNDEPIRGAGGYLLNLLVWPDNNNITNYQTADWKKLLLYGSAPNSESDNPYFNINFNRSNDNTSRFIGSMAINIFPTLWLILAGRFGYDTYRSIGLLSITHCHLYFHRYKVAC